MYVPIHVYLGRNEVTRLMRISVVRGTQREKTATVTLVQNDL